MEDTKTLRILEQLSSREPQPAWTEFLEGYSALIFQIVRLFEREPDRAGDCFLYVCEKLSERRFRRMRQFKPQGQSMFSTWLRAVVRNLCLDWHRREYGRQRVFQSIARLLPLDQEVFSCLHVRGLSKEETFFALHASNSRLTQAQVEESVERIQQALTPRQLWLLSTRQRRVESREIGVSEGKDVSDLQIPDPAPDPEALTAMREQQSAVARAFERLSKPERLLLRLRFEQGLTLREVADILEIKDAQTADRRIQEVLEKLRGELTAL